MNNVNVTGIGGGTGLSTLFRGLRNENITDMSKKWWAVNSIWNERIKGW